MEQIDEINLFEKERPENTVTKGKKSIISWEERERERERWQREFFSDYERREKWNGKQKNI